MVVKDFRNWTNMWDWNPVGLQSDNADVNDFPSAELYLLSLQKGSEPHDKSPLKRRWKMGRIRRKLFSISAASDELN